MHSFVSILFFQISVKKIVGKNLRINAPQIIPDLSLVNLNLGRDISLHTRDMGTMGTPAGKIEISRLRILRKFLWHRDRHARCRFDGWIPWLAFRFLRFRSSWPHMVLFLVDNHQRQTWGRSTDFRGWARVYQN